LINEEIVLGFDTSAAHCAAALLLKNTMLDVISEDMPKGQAEMLGPMVLDLLAKNQLDIQDIKRIGVGIGPGNFTGIRIAVSFARGLGLSLQIPVIGVDSFEATYLNYNETAIVTVPATRNEFYFQKFPRTNINTQIATLDEVSRHDIKIIERCAARVLVENISRLAAREDPKDFKPVAPLYIKPADAITSRDVKPKILS
tara:strand:+ start:151 stop:750 length:600 start_codon:yes stop_codon:yes gene_type:complete